MVTHRVLALLHGAYGIHGGIAAYNRRLLGSLAADEACAEVVALPRLRGTVDDALPANLDFVQTAGSGIGGYLSTMLGRLGRDRAFDLIVCVHINLSPFAWVARRLTRSPVLTILHGIDAWAPPARLSARRTFRTAIRYAAVSQLTRERFRAWSGIAEDRISLLPNSVDLTRFTPGAADPALRRRYGLQDRRIVMTLARLDRDKGVDEFLAILPRLAEQVPDVAYLVIGDGSERERLTAQARHMGVGDRCRFIGSIAERDKVDHLRLADAFVLAGREEGFGIVLLEAMACGVPVVASRLDGSREAVMNGACGAVVDPRDPDELVSGVLAALAAPKGVRPDGIEAFSTARFDARLRELVAQMLGHQHR